MMRQLEYAKEHALSFDATDAISWALAMLREAENHLEVHICNGHPCKVCVWLAKLREEA